MVVEWDEFKGDKIMVLKPDLESKYGLRFGSKKARLIVQHFKEIRKFAEDG